MATKTITELPPANPADLGDATLLPVDDNERVTRKVTVAQLRTALGALTATGDVIGSGTLASIVLTIAANAVTLAKLAPISTQRILGRHTSGTGVVQQIEVGAGLSLVAGVLSAGVAAGSAPSASLLTHRAFGGL